MTAVIRQIDCSIALKTVSLANRCLTHGETSDQRLRRQRRGCRECPDDSSGSVGHNRDMTAAPPSEPTKVPVSRTLVGIISLTCLCVGPGLLLARPDDDSVRLWAAGFNRAGLLMGALWFALPSGNRGAAWANVSIPALGGGLLGLLALVRNPRVLLPMIAVLGVVFFLKRFLGGGRTPARNRPDRTSWK